MGNFVIQPPLGGIVKNTGFQQRPPFTAYDLLNIWPIDPFTGRGIIASRPPLQQLASPAGFVTLLANVNGVVAGKPTQSFIGAFNGAISWWNGTGFTAATGAFTVPTDRPTYAATFLNKVYIPKAASKLTVFDYNNGSLATLVETVGTSPTNTFFAVQWMGAIWVVSLTDPHIVYVSRAGVPTDWDSAAPIDDEFGAFFFTPSSGRAFGGPVTAIVPQTSDSGLISTLNGTFIQRGHPRQGGVTDIISPTYILGQGAWCKTPDDTVFFLTPKGMMYMPPGSNTIPTLVSKNKIPEELLGLNYVYENPVVSMAYDSRWNGVVITVRGAQDQSWLYDLASGGFFRQEFDGYPFVLMEHEPFVSEQTSGVLFGGTTLRYLDKFGSEQFETAGVIGPIKLSESSRSRSKIINLKAIFGGDTPTGTGTVSVATGTDGPDAINRALLGQYQYIADITKLAANDGVCFPLASGHAAVVSFSLNSGRVSFEQIELAVDESGLNNLPRSAQMSVDGSALDFTAPSDGFDSSEWVGYSQATPAVPNCSLPDHTHLIDLARLPTTWWDTVSSTGGDVRATDNNNTTLPLDVIEFNKVAKTGLAAVKMSQQNPPSLVRVWCGNPDVSAVAANSTFGQYNAYDANWKAFWPSGRITDRTQNLNTLTMTGLLADPNVAGPIGNSATNFVNGADTTDNFGSTTVAVPAFFPLTLVSAIFNNAATDISRDAMAVNGTNATNHSILSAERLAGPLARSKAISNDGVTSNTANSGSVGTPAAWRQYAAVFASATSRSAYIDGGSKVTTTVSVSPATPTSITVGKGAPPGLSAASLQGHVSLASVHDTARSDCWIDYQNRMLNQATFWGSWGAFQTINPAPAPDPNDPAEVGTWSGYATATPAKPVGSNQPDWVHWIDLSRLPVDWWNAVSATGVDIRATNQSNKFLAFDLIEFDKVAKTGFACVKASQNTASDVPIRLWVGNAIAITVPTGASYSKYAVYDVNWLGFWPSGGGSDRTRNQRNLTMSGSPTVGGVAGTIGNKATNYNGTTQYGSVSFSETSAPAVQMAGVARFSSVSETAAILSANRTQYTGHVTLANAPYANPTRLKLRSNTGDLVDASSEVVESLNTWVHKAGLTAGNIYRGVFVNGVGDDITADTGISNKNIGKHLFNRFTVGARISGASTINWPWSGDLTLLSIHDKARSLDDDWSAYQHSMLNQATFWGSWVWTAESNGLPQ